MWKSIFNMLLQALAIRRDDAFSTTMLSNLTESPIDEMSPFDGKQITNKKGAGLEHLVGSVQNSCNCFLNHIQLQQFHVMQAHQLI